MLFFSVQELGQLKCIAFSSSFYIVYDVDYTFYDRNCICDFNLLINRTVQIVQSILAALSTLVSFLLSKCAFTAAGTVETLVVHLNKPNIGCI